MDVKSFSGYENIKDFVRENCMDALMNPTIIYRGIGRTESAALDSFGSLVTPANSERKSRNTTNWYTVILDSNPDMFQYPKRSKSLICSTDIHYAEDFGGRVAIMLPVNGSKIGCVNEFDLWEAEPTLFGTSLKIQDMNHLWQELSVRSKYELKATAESFMDFANKVKTDKFLQEAVKFSFPKIDKDYNFNHFMDDVYDAYNPNKLGFSAVNPKTLTAKNGGEVWLGGPVVEVSFDLHTKLLVELRNGKTN